MILRTSPQSHLAPLHYAQAGDVLTVSGRAFDFSPLTEGARLPLDAVPGGWLLADVTREGGEVVLTVAEPNTVLAPPPGPPGLIDWSRMRTAEQLAAERLAVWRASASISVIDFALVALQAGLLSPTDAEGWVTRQAVPPVVQAAVDTLPEAARIEARLRIMGASTVERASPFVALMQSHMGLSDAQVDALFAWPA